jgi:hypothetical protein
MSAESAVRNPDQPRRRVYKPRARQNRPDGRTVSSRRWRTLIKDFTDELGGGPLSALDRSLVEQAAALSLRVELVQVAIISGACTDPDEIIRLSGEHRRLLTTLRAKAVKNKPAGPTLEDLFADAEAAK